MYSVIRLVDIAEADRDRVREDLQQVAQDCGALRHLVAPTLAGSRNGGDLLVHLRFDSADAWSLVTERFEVILCDPAITRVNGADYPGSPRIIDDRPPGRVYRTLLLRVAPDTAAETVARFEADLQLLPGYVTTISAWQLSRPERTVGDAGWTHVFEQEFTDAEGIMGAYLMHPIHWAVVDQWFDPECPKVVVRGRVCHSFCTDDTHVLR